MNRKSRILQYSVQTQTTCAYVLTRLRAYVRADVSSKVNYRGAALLKMCTKIYIFLESGENFQQHLLIPFFDLKTFFSLNFLAWVLAFILG